MFKEEKKPIEFCLLNQIKKENIGMVVLNRLLAMIKDAN